MATTSAADAARTTVRPPCRAVLFDLDETLLPDEAATDAALLATCRACSELAGRDHLALARAVRRQAGVLWRAGPALAYCRAVGVASWEGLWGDLSGEGAELATLRAWAPAYRREAWRRALAEQGQDSPALAEALSRAFPAERRARLLPDPEAAVVLAALRPRCRLAVVTNGAPALQREKLRRAGLDALFDAVVVSGDLGVGKPDPAPFRTALDFLGTPAHEAAMVGDSLERDVLGAQRAGLRTVWLDRAGRGVDDSPIVADARISRLAELPTALGLVR